MTSYVSAELRRIVRDRARKVCEYCLIYDDDSYLGCHVDHIIAEKHGGSNDESNLSFACVFCNRAKGTDIGSIAESTQEYCRFYNPRTDHWADHFRIEGVKIVPMTPFGEVTARLLQFNHSERLMEREALAQINRYPPKEAAHLLAPDSGTL